MGGSRESGNGGRNKTYDISNNRVCMYAIAIVHATPLVLKKQPSKMRVKLDGGIVRKM